LLKYIVWDDIWNNEFHVTESVLQEHRRR